MSLLICDFCNNKPPNKDLHRWFEGRTHGRRRQHRRTRPSQAMIPMTQVGKPLGRCDLKYKGRGRASSEYFKIKHIYDYIYFWTVPSSIKVYPLTIRPALPLPLPLPLALPPTSLHLPRYPPPVTCHLSPVTCHL